MPARHTIYEDKKKKKQSQHTSSSFVGEREKKTNLAHVIGPGIEDSPWGNTREPFGSAPQCQRKPLEEGSGLRNIVPATLSLLSEQIMNAPTRVRD